jgi:peptidoglycan/xylan/chitin deacetylase (PgdA/CDA1 family)
VVRRIRRSLALAVALLAGACSDPSPPAESTAALTAPPPPPASSPPSAPPTPPPPRPQLDGRAFPDKVLALTWDDGPDARTLELARYLRAQHVAATFFVVAAWVEGVSSDPGAGSGVFATGHARLPVLGDLVALGHRIGNHTLNHVLLSDAGAAGVTRQLRESQALLEPFLGNGLRLFRAPGGAWNAEASAAVEADPVLRRLAGPVRWDVDGKDWEGSLYCHSERPLVECEPAAPGGASRVKPKVIARRYLAAVEAAGHGIVLLHDRVGHVGSRYALDVAEALVPELIARGYVFAAPVLRFSSPTPRAGVDLGGAPPPTPGPPVTLEGVDGPIQLGDVNGDGRPDACGLRGEGVVCALSAGRAFTRPSLWLGAAEIDAAGWRDGFRLRDVDGDGRADVCGVGPGGVSCGLAP